MNYKQLSQVERYQIYALIKDANDQAQIVKTLERYKSPIRQELSHNRGLNGYRLKQACAFAVKLIATLNFPFGSWAR